VSQILQIHLEGSVAVVQVWQLMWLEEYEPPFPHTTGLVSGVEAISASKGFLEPVLAFRGSFST
jgi:hypothetical protein